MRWLLPARGGGKAPPNGGIRPGSHGVEPSLLHRPSAIAPVRNVPPLERHPPKAPLQRRPTTTLGTRGRLVEFRFRKRGRHVWPFASPPPLVPWQRAPRNADFAR